MSVFMLLIILAIVFTLLSAFSAPGPIAWGWLGLALAIGAFGLARGV